ncbi:vWA domain-containing protein [Corynebacterium vitaeruminis]|nr:VWA domain-containing protein [Corynebacterium vitaeruminis]
MKPSTGSSASRLVAALIVAAVMVLWGGFVPSSARADDATAAKAELILDLSGSMLADDVGGTRLDAAKKASTELIDALPDTANLGMMVYGARESSDPDNQARGCEDIEVLAPVEAIDKEGLKSKIAGVDAKGYTPIGKSLRKAADELGKEGERSIILVSDGIDTCAAPPACEVANELAGQGYDIAIHTVGFKVDEAARAELECIANATGGQYLPADDAGQLSNSMKFLAQRSINDYEATGTKFSLEKEKTQAKWLGQGRYQTTVVPEAKPSSQKPTPQFFRLAIPENTNAIITAKVLGNKAANGLAEQTVHAQVVEATNESNNKCQRFEALVDSISTASKDSATPAYASIARIEPYSTADRQDTFDPACDQTKWVVGVGVFVDENSSYAGTNDGVNLDPVRVEVEVQFEPFLSNDEANKLKEGEKGSLNNGGIPQPEFGPKAEPIQGGNSYAHAAEVESGVTYSDAMVPGEMKFYKIPIEWGERPVVGLRTKPSERDSVDEINGFLTSPQYVPLDNLELNVFHDAEEDSAASELTIEYNNRFLGGTSEPMAQAGNYYVAVTFDVGNDGATLGVEQPYELVVRRDGETSSGPSWRPTEENGPEPSDEPILTRVDGALASGSTSAAPTDATAANTAEAESEESGMNAGALVGAAAAVVVVVAGAFFLLRRRR